MNDNILLNLNTQVKLLKVKLLIDFVFYNFTKIYVVAD